MTTSNACQLVILVKIERCDEEREGRSVRDIHEMRNRCAYLQGGLQHQ